MRGHEILIRRRLAREVFRDVWVWVGDSPRIDFSRDWDTYGLAPEVVILPEDRIELLDFRWCIGLMVHIHGTDSIERIAKVHREATLSGAQMVFTLLGDDMLYNKGEEIALAGRVES
jgi:hypothetical protein